MNLLRYCSQRPRARAVFVDADCGDLATACADGRKLLSVVRDFAAQHISPEFRKALWITAIEGDRSQASYRHGLDATEFLASASFAEASFVGGLDVFGTEDGESVFLCVLLGFEIFLFEEIPVGVEVSVSSHSSTVSLMNDSCSDTGSISSTAI